MYLIQKYKLGNFTKISKLLKRSRSTLEYQKKLGKVLSLPASTPRSSTNDNVVQYTN